MSMSVFMNDIAATGGAEQVRKGIRNCKKREMKNKIWNTK